MQITDPSKWSAYIAQLKSEPQAANDAGIGIIFRGTADYEALGQRFKSGRKLATNVLSEGEWHIRERSTGNLVARVKTVELLKPYFGYSETLDCIFTHPGFYQRWTGNA